MGSVTLVSSDGVEFTVDKDVAIKSNLIYEMIFEDDPEDTSCSPIPLFNVKEKTLKKIIQFMEHIKIDPLGNIEKPLKKPLLEDIVPSWYNEYINVEQDELFDIVLAANYMDIRELLDLSCAKVATMIRGKTPEEIRKIFNIENDFLTPQEEDKIRQECKWCEQ